MDKQNKFMRVKIDGACTVQQSGVDVEKRLEFDFETAVLERKV